MWFQRMPLEEWFDQYQYRTQFDVGESAVKYLALGDLGIDLSRVALRYGHHAGHPDLRALIATEYDGLPAEHVVVTSGAAEAIFAIVAAIVEPGDEVVVEHPNYPSTYEVARGLGCHVRFLPLEFDASFRPDLDRLDALVTGRTRLIVFTHPNNPTGSMIEPGELARLVAFAESRSIRLLFDETYRHLAYGPPLPTAASLSRWATSVTSMSKCYGLPGIRIGWLATRDTDLLQRVLAVREQVTITNGALNEAIATAVLARREEFIDRARTHVEGNLCIAREWMARQALLEWVPPQGGVVALPRLKAAAIEDPDALYVDLAEKHGVFVIPGRCFEVDNRFFRLGFGGTTVELTAGLGRLGAALTAA